MEITKPKQATLNIDSKQYLHTICDTLLKYNFPLLKLWQWTFVTDVFANIIRHLQEGEEDYLDQYSLCGAYGTGKTTTMIHLIPYLMIYISIVEPEKTCKAVVISGTESQVYAVFWRDLKALLRTKNDFTITERLCHLTKHPRIVLEPRIANKGNIHALAGIHADYVLVILEEAPAIDRTVFDKVLTYFSHVDATKGMLFVVGNPVRRDSFFYEITETDIGKNWHRYRIARNDVAPLKDGFTQRVIDAYGVDSDEYRINVLGLHGLDSTDAFIPEYVMDSALNRPWNQIYNGPYYFGVDVSSGGSTDYSVILVRNNETIVDIFYEKLDTDSFTTEIIAWINWKNAHYVAIDEVGVGLGVLDRLKREFYGKDVRIEGVNGGSSAYDKYRFGNLRTELGWKMREWLQYYGHLPKNLPYVEQLKTELRSLRAAPNQRGIYQLESKTKLSKSPDIADAFSYSFGGGRFESTNMIAKSNIYANDIWVME